VKIVRFSTLVLTFMSMLAACGAPNPEADDSSGSSVYEIRSGNVATTMNALWSLQPYTDATGRPYQIKIADMKGTAFGSDPVTFGPFPTGYNMPSDPKSCFWQRSWFQPDGSVKMDCDCLVAQVPSAWASSFTVATPPPPGTAPVNMKVAFYSGAPPVYMPCYDRVDRGCFQLPTGGIECR